MFNAFIRSVAIGTLASGLVPALIGLIFSVCAFLQPIGDRSLSVFLLPLGVLLVVFACVITGAVFVGLPATLLLTKTRLESERAYNAVGVVAAIAVVVAICAFDEVWGGLPILITLGLPGGIFAGRSWYWTARASGR